MIKYKLLIFMLIVLTMTGLYVPLLYSQNPTFTCTIENISLPAGNEFEFDIYVLNTSAIPMELGGAQFGFLYNTAILNGGTLTASYITGSVDSAIVASGQENTNFITTTPGVIKITAKLATGGRGTGAIISTVPPGTKLGRLRVINSTSFSQLQPDLKFCFDISPYPTKISSYINGTNTVNTDTTAFINLIDNSALPVELTSFGSNVSGRQVNLKWETKSELNTRQFEIERALVSVQGGISGWAKAGTVNAAGTSVTPKLYSYVEKNLQGGKYQYRLKIIDIDGSYKYSKIIEAEISLPKDFELSQNYPNPFNPTTKIDYQLPNDARVVLEVYSITGQKVLELINKEEKAGYYSVNFGSSTVKLASGIYLYRISAIESATGKNFASIKKMMLLK